MSFGIAARWKCCCALPFSNPHVTFVDYEEVRNCTAEAPKRCLPIEGHSRLPISRDRAIVVLQGRSRGSQKKLRREKKRNERRREREVHANHAVENKGQRRTSHDLKRVTAHVKNFPAVFQFLGWCPPVFGLVALRGCRSQRFKVPVA